MKTNFSILTVILAATGLYAQGTAFTYQGRLNTGNAPANGTYDLLFTVYASASGINDAFANQTNSATSVSNGLFTVTLNLGAPGIFTGEDRWLEIEVRTNGPGLYAKLSPRQKITATPYAITAGNVVSGGLPAGTYGNAVTFNNPGNSFSGNGGGLTNVNAVTLGGYGYCALPCYWNLGGNAGTAPGLNFVGTSDNQPFTLRVNNIIALQFQPATVPNVVGGLAAFRPSVIANGVSGAVIAGGNAPSGGVNGFGGGDFQAVYDNDGVVGGGFGNKVGTDNGDVTDAAFATVGGGVFNGAAGYAATVAGGDANFSGGSRSAVGGGYGNAAVADFSAVGGGLGNSALGNGATIGGGQGNTASGPASTVAGGVTNASSGDSATVGGGQWNTAGASYSIVDGGLSNLVDSLSLSAVIGGGRNNRIQAGLTLPPFVTFTGDANTIAGGADNLISHTEFPLPFSTTTAGTIGGGQGNDIQRGGNGTIGGGFGNQVTSGNGATISGGIDNSVAGDYGSVMGGNNNFASFNALAAGTRAKASNIGSFVWADSQAADFSSSANNDFSIRASGGVRLNTDTSMFFGNQTRQMINLWSTAYAIGVQASAEYFRTDGDYYWYKGGTHNDSNGNAGGGSTLMHLSNTELRVNGTFVSACDRNVKSGFTPVDAMAVLEKVAALPITRWHYTNDVTRPHLGPMAQDFYAAFNVGGDDKHIAVVDEGGVALAAIQGLNEKLEQKEMEITELKQRLEKIERLLEKTGGPK